MPIIGLIIVLAIFGFVLWLINAKIPMQPTVKLIINIVACVALVVWLLRAFGLMHYLTEFRV